MTTAQVKITVVQGNIVKQPIFAYPPELAIPILIRTARDTAQHLQHVEEVRFVVLDADLYRQFAEAIQRTA